MILPYRPASTFSKDLFITYLESLNVPLKNVRFDASRNDYSIEIHDLDFQAVEPLFLVIDHRYNVLNRMRSFRDYHIINEYPHKSAAFFKHVIETKLVSKTLSLQISSNGVYYLTNSACNHIQLRAGKINNTVLWISRRFRPIAISNLGHYSILRDRHGFYLINNLNEHLIKLDRLNPAEPYIFIFNETDKNFGVIDQYGEFTYMSVSGQPLIKLRLFIDSFLDVKQVVESRLIITDSAIYSFTGEKITSGAGQYVFHHYKSNQVVRENLFTQKIEIVESERVIHQFDIYADRLINRVIRLDALLVINYEDDLLHIIHIPSRQEFSLFTQEKIRSIGYQSPLLYVLLVNNTLQIIELNPDILTSGARTPHLRDNS